MPVSRRPRILAGLATLLAALALGAPAAAQITSATLSSGGSSCTLTNCVTVPMTNRAGLGIDITGSGTWTVVFEGLKGAPGTATWRQVPYTDDSSPTTVATTSVTSEGSFTIANLGYTAIRVRASSYTSGTPVVSLTPSAGVGGGGGAGGTVTANAGTNLNTSALLTEAAFEAVFGTSSVVSADRCNGGTKVYYNARQTADTQLVTGTASNHLHLCHVSVLQSSSSTQTWSLVSGTGSTCATSIGAVLGGTTAAAGAPALSVVKGNGDGLVAKTVDAGDNLCLLQSSTDPITVSLVYVVAP